MKKIFFIISAGLVVFAIVIFFAGFFVFHWLTQPVDSTRSDTLKIVVQKGQSILSIGDSLTNAGLIRHPQLFRLEVMRSGLAKSIQSGTFEISPSQSLAEITEALTHGSQDIWITIPEGLRREEVAQLLTDNDLKFFSAPEFIEETATLEGSLYPDTYLLPKQIEASEVVNLLRQTFEKKVGSQLASEVSKSNRSWQEILSMASLVQRESASVEEMPLVAGVLWNRVDLGMPLGVDATLQYIAGQNKSNGKWWSSPDVSLKESDSSFNTYRFAGLPPSPIANPGYDAIFASLHPEETDYLYYIHANNQIYLARTLIDHNHNINRYLR